VSGYLRVADVAETLDVSPRTVLRWIAVGDLEALRLPGGRLRISQSAYSGFLAGCATTNQRRTVAAVEEEAR
jgi:excisionase family DNA binding protein